VRGITGQRNRKISFQFTPNYGMFAIMCSLLSFQSQTYSLILFLPGLASNLSSCHRISGLSRSWMGEKNKMRKGAEIVADFILRV
jgi:hypothetical protein